MVLYRNLWQFFGIFITPRVGSRERGLLMTLNTKVLFIALIKCCKISSVFSVVNYSRSRLPTRGVMKMPKTTAKDYGEVPLF